MLHRFVKITNLCKEYHFLSYTIFDNLTQNKCEVLNFRTLLYTVTYKNSITNYNRLVLTSSQID